MAAKLVKEGLCWCLQFSRERRFWKLRGVQAPHCFEPHLPQNSIHPDMKLEMEVENTTLLAVAGVTVLIAVLIGVGIQQSGSTTSGTNEPDHSSTAPSAEKSNPDETYPRTIRLENPIPVFTSKTAINSYVDEVSRNNEGTEYLMQLQNENRLYKLKSGTNVTITGKYTYREVTSFKVIHNGDKMYSPIEMIKNLNE